MDGELRLSRIRQEVQPSSVVQLVQRGDGLRTAPELAFELNIRWKNDERHQLHGGGLRGRIFEAKSVNGWRYTDRLGHHLAVVQKTIWPRYRHNKTCGQQKSFATISSSAQTVNQSGRFNLHPQTLLYTSGNIPHNTQLILLQTCSDHR